MDFEILNEILNEITSSTTQENFWTKMENKAVPGAFKRNSDQQSRISKYISKNEIDLRNIRIGIENEEETEEAEIL